VSRWGPPINTKLLIFHPCVTDCQFCKPWHVSSEQRTNSTCCEVTVKLAPRNVTRPPHRQAAGRSQWQWADKSLRAAGACRTWESSLEIFEFCIGAPARDEEIANQYAMLDACRRVVSSRLASPRTHRDAPLFFSGRASSKWLTGWVRHGLGPVAQARKRNEQSSAGCKCNYSL